MKILHLIGGGDIGGAKTHVLALLRGLRDGAEVKLISFREGGFADDARAMGIDVEIMPGNPLRCLGLLRKLYRDGGYDIVHSHGARGNMMAVSLKLLEGATVLTTVHSDPQLDYLGRPLAALTFGLINRLALRLIKHHAAVSDPVCDMLIQRGFSPFGVFPIYNGVSFHVKQDGAFDRTVFLAQYGLEVQRGDVIVGIVARLTPVKDIPTLLRAFAKTPENAKLIIAGDGEDADALKRLRSELGLENRVAFAGWVDDTDSFYRSLDINTLTSLSETFPYALTDGTRHRLATVSSRVGGIPVLIDSGKNGYLYPAGDADALAVCLTTLIENDGLRRDFGDGLYVKAKRLFSIEATIARQHEIYKTVLRREKSEHFTVTICGAYGKHNSGDDAILDAICTELRSIDADVRIYVLSRSPSQTRLGYRADSFYTFNIFKLRRALKRSQLYINGGGSLMQDSSSTRSLLFYLYTLKRGKKSGCKVMQYGCGIGPIAKPRNRRRAARYMNRYTDAITLRESMSLDELAALGVTAPDITLSADPALTLEPEGTEAVRSALVDAGANPDGDYVLFALRRWKNHAIEPIIAAVADQLYRERGLTALFLPIEAQDVETAKTVVGVMNTPSVSLENTVSPRLAIGIMSIMRCVVGMRLHALIFASGQAVPLVGVAYDPKVSAFMQYMEKPHCIDLNAVDITSLTDLIMSSIDTHDADASKVAVMRLRDAERHNLEAAKTLLGGRK